MMVSGGEGLSVEAVRVDDALRFSFSQKASCDRMWSHEHINRHLWHQKSDQSQAMERNQPTGGDFLESEPRLLGLDIDLSARV